MLKRDELADPNSCWNRARDDEVVFVLLARDEAISDTLRFWVSKRLLLGKNLATDPQIVTALQAADDLERLNR